MIRLTRIDVDEMVTFLVNIGRAERLLPDVKYLNMDTLYADTEITVERAERSGVPAYELSARLVGLWFPTEARLRTSEQDALRDNIEDELQRLGYSKEGFD